MITTNLIDTDLLEPAAVDVDWTLARCRDGAGTLTHLFFAEDLYDIARAKAICSKCSLAEACLSGALERREPWGCLLYTSPSPRD